MTLLEIYNKLLARGMPEAEVEWTSFHEPCYRCSMDGTVALLTENAARAIITMHALEWWRDLRPEGAKWAVCVAAICDCWEGPTCVASAPTIIEAIEAATRHLEPKEKP